MPQLCGLRTLEALQSHPLFWQIPAIVLANSARAEEEALSYALGAVRFERKPPTLPAMTEFISRAVELARPADEYREITKDDVLNLRPVLDLTKRPRRTIDLRSDRADL